MTKSRIEKWLDEYKSKNTRKVYIWGLKGFFNVKSKAELIAKSEQYLDACQSGEKTIDDITDDIISFLDRIEVRKDGTPAPPKSVWSRVQTVKVFFDQHNFEVPASWFKRLKTRRFDWTGAVHNDYVPTSILELRLTLGFMTPQGRALFSLMATSGCRINEAMQVRVKDVVLEDKNLAPHVRLRMGTTKGGRPRLAFMTSETKTHIKEWLAVRDQYLIKVAKKTPKQYARPENDMRLFPFSTTTSYVIWTVAVRKAGLLEKDENTNRYTFHPHCLRKWVRTRLGGVLKQDVAEALIGHSSYLSREYRKYTNEQLSEFYLKGQSVLLLNTKVVMKSELDAQTGQVESLEARIAGLESLIRDVANGTVSKDWLKAETHEEPSEEEQSRVLRELDEQNSNGKKPKAKKRRKKAAKREEDK